MRAPAPTVLDRVLATLARRALRRAAVRRLLDLEVGPVRREGDMLFVPDGAGGWRHAGTPRLERATQWRPSSYWTRERAREPTGWFAELPPNTAHAPGWRRLP